MSLELTRKRAKEIKKLRKQADKLWAEQRAVNLHAAELARKARANAKAYSRESLVPAADRIAQRGRDAGRQTLDRASKGWNRSVVPALAGGLGSVAALARIGKDDRVQDAIENLRRYATLPELEPARPVRTGPSAAQWLLIGVGAATLAGAGYAAWQTLRADDDLWIPDADDAALDAPRAAGTTPASDAQASRLGGAADGAASDDATL